jgi:hypothetical protein
MSGSVIARTFALRMMTTSLRWPILTLLYFAVCLPVRGQMSEGEAFFESRVRPLFVAHCQECHTTGNAESELSLDSLQDLLQGGSRGPAVVPGNPAESLLVSAVKHGETLKMPPKTKLTPAQVSDLMQWIAMGCPWPNSAPSKVVARSAAALEPELTPEQRSFWAFQIPVRPEIPNLRQDEAPNGSTVAVTAIDAFIGAGLMQAGLRSSPPAEKAALLRRATFDLTGLPPSPQQIDEFLSDSSSDAFEKLVERLLATPQYGEKWARHWLDVARYADSNGLDENLAYANAFRYRDYVIASFNNDKPYDQFVREQIAGDLLAHDGNDAVRLERLVATGFLSLGAKMLAEDDPMKMQMDIIDEQVDTIGRTFMGLTLGCARCHDHKFDPVSTADYYGLAGIFKSSKTMENFKVVARWQELPLATQKEVDERNRQQELLAAVQAKATAIVTSENNSLLTTARAQADSYLLAACAIIQRESLLTNAVSQGALPKDQQNPQVIAIEAESFSRGNVLRDTEGYGRGIGVLVNQGEVPNFVEYDIDVKTSGLSQFELRYAAAESRPCRILINGRIVSTTAADDVSGGWDAEQQKWFVEGLFPLQAGKNLIRIERDGAFPHIDQIAFSPASADVQSTMFTPSVAEENLVASWVQQWRYFLLHPEKDFDGLFGAWRNLLQGRASDHEASEKQLELLGGAAPKLPAELAAIYQNRIADVVKQAGQAADPATVTLTDPVDEALRKILFHPERLWKLTPELESSYSAAARAELVPLRADIAAREAALPKFNEAMVVTDQTPENLKIHVRGSHLTLGAEVPRRVPRILAGDSGRVFSPSGSGRLELAQWLTDRQHPLTARVMVNRIWQWHFGAGLVRSPDNFGMLGETPTHPELLDWLAIEFMDRGWSLKEMHRLIMNSATYQMGTNHPDPPTVKDPENRLWWHFPRRRLNAEEVRDAILVAAGTLDPLMTGTMLTTANRAYVTSTASVHPDVYRSNRRSVYLPVVRSALYDVFQAFDFADPTSQSGLRQATTVAPQALFMMNSELVSKQTMEMADRLMRQEADDAGRVRSVWLSVLGRQPTAAEIENTIAYLDGFEQRLSGAVDGRKRAWQSLCRAVISTNEFLFLE